MRCLDQEDIMAAPVGQEDTADTTAGPVGLAAVIADHQWAEGCTIGRTWAVECGTVHHIGEAAAAVYSP